MIGLMSSSGKSTLKPRKRKLDRERGQFVLRRIDEVLAWEKSFEEERDARFAELGRYLCEVRDSEYWRLEQGCHNFEEYLARKFPASRRKAYYLMSIHDHLRPFLRTKEIDELGWSKAAELAKVARSQGREFKCATWLHKARELPREEFKREVEHFFTGQYPEPTETLCFRLTESQMEVVERALHTAALMIGSEKSRSHCLELICADFLAGASVEADPELLYLSVTRMYGLLQPKQQIRFLNEAQTKTPKASLPETTKNPS